MGLDEVRSQIADINKRIIELLQQRAELALLAAEIKTKAGLPVFDPEQEASVIDAISGDGGPMTTEALRLIFRVIIRETRQLEEAHVGPD